jgi:hypothetical protein
VSNLLKLKTMEAAEAREFIKANLGPELIKDVVENKEDFLPLLARNKMVPEAVLAEFCTSETLATFAVKCLSEESYVPPVSFIESLIQISDEAVLLALRSFPSIPFSGKFLAQLLNENRLLSATHLVKLYPAFRGAEIVISLLKKNVSDPLLTSLALESPIIMNALLTSLTEDGKDAPVLPAEIVTAMYLNKENKEISDHVFTKQKMTTKGYKKLFTKLIKARKKAKADNQWFSESEMDLVWSQDLEEFDLTEAWAIGFKIRISNPPMDSKFRLDYVFRNPSEATDEELMELRSRFENMNTGNSRTERARSHPRRFLQAILSRPTSFAEKFGLSIIFERSSPSEFVSALPSDLATHLFYLEKAPQKYRAGIRKLIPSEHIPPEHVPNKRSYFFEAFDALKVGDIESFRSVLSRTYNLSMFAKDSMQDSKKGLFDTQCRGIKESWAPLIEKEEFLTLCHSSLRMSALDASDIKFKLSADEAYTAMAKLSVDGCFDLCSDHPGFIRRLDGSQTLDLLNYKVEKLTEIPALIRQVIKQLKKSTLDSEGIEAKTINHLSKSMTGEQLRSVISDSCLSWDKDACISVKCTDGTYLVPDAEVFNGIDKWTIERDSFLEDLKQRDPKMFLDLVQGYVASPEKLRSLLGKTQVKRTQLEKFRGILEQEKLDQGELVNKLFKSRSIEEMRAIFGWKTLMEQHARGRSIHFEEMLLSDLTSEFSCFKELSSFEISKLIANSDYSDEHSGLSNTDMAHVKIGHILISDRFTHDEGLELTKIIKYAKSHQIPMSTSTTELRDLIHYVRCGGPVEWLTPGIASIDSIPDDEFPSLTVSDIEVLCANGLVLLRERVKRILVNCTDSHLDELVAFFDAGLGSLKGMVFDASQISSPALERSGALIVSSDEYEIFELKEKVKSQGSSFSPIDVSDFATKQKQELIRWITENVDPNYASLNLGSVNLELIDELLPFSEMKSTYATDTESLAALLLIPKNQITNKKLIKGLQDIVSTQAGSFVSCVHLMKYIMAETNPNIVLDFSDFVNVSGESVSPSDLIRGVTSPVLRVIHEALQANEYNLRKFFLARDKKNMTRFLRSASAKDVGYANDVFEMMHTVNKGCADLLARADLLAADGEDDAEKATRAAVASVLTRLDEIGPMDDIEHIHDRLVPLLTFIESDPNQPLGQDKFSKLEKSKEVVKELGHSIFFPKTRDDLVYLGDNNNWCVNRQSSYGDGVISKGNILVGFCDEGLPSARENVIALAHFEKKNDGYYLEQLRWSSRKMKSGMVSAIGSFKHNDVLKLIVNEIEKRKGV